MLMLCFVSLLISMFLIWLSLKLLLVNSVSLCFFCLMCVLEFLKLKCVEIFLFDCLMVFFILIMFVLEMMLNDGMVFFFEMWVFGLCVGICYNCGLFVILLMFFCLFKVGYVLFGLM